MLIKTFFLALKENLYRVTTLILKYGGWMQALLVDMKLQLKCQFS